MSYISLYRKYRPKSFQEIIGQAIIALTLTNSIKLNKVTHAYIFAGPKGVGKTTIAKIFAKAINCLHPINGDACNQCANCQIINKNQTTDILELDAASNNGVDEVRTIIDGVRFLPTSLSKKVYIIDEAHMLTVQAWNAMLKTIEEAPQHIIFIFATTEMHKIPPTILSRSQHFLFNRLTHPELSGMLSTIAQQEHITIANEAIDKIISLADGSARDTLSILEQMSMYTNNQIKLNDVIDVFGLVDLDNKIKLINLILHRDTKAIMELLDNYDQNGINFSQLANDLIVILIDKLIFLQTNNFTILKNLTASTVELIKIDESTCIKLINVWQEAFMKMRNANDARFYFELAVFNSFKSEPGTISKPVVATNVPSPSTTTKPITPVPKTKELPPLDQVFTITPYQVNQPKVIPKSDKTKITKLDKNMLFYQIAYNNNKKCLQDAKHFLEKIKADNLTKVLSFITIADKVLVASCHGMVLLFEDEVDAELLNAKSNTYDFLNEIKKHFNNPIQVLGLTKEMGKQMANDFMKLKKQGNTFDEPDITTLKEIIKANNSVEQLAFELFGAK